MPHRRYVAFALGVAEEHGHELDMADPAVQEEVSQVCVLMRTYDDELCGALTAEQLHRLLVAIGVEMDDEEVAPARRDARAAHAFPTRPSPTTCDQTSPWDAGGRAARRE